MQNETPQQEALGQLYGFAADLRINQNKSSEEVVAALTEKGLSQDAAYTITNQVEDEINRAKKSHASKDMLFGALWLIGGTIATASNIGFIFWGAILFGCIQFIKGLVNYLRND